MRMLRCALAGLLFLAVAGFAGQTPTDYKVLAPITRGNLTIFPVLASSAHDTSGFVTLDEGLRSGEVVITEAGRVQGLVRRRPPLVLYRGSGDGAEVNRLVLVNNSKRPLLLLAGEIVTGGKQDRIIAKDRIVPAGADPIDLTVFCVEPGRWTAVSAEFKAGGSAGIAQPSVRAQAMAHKDQQRVWNEVRRSNETALAMAPTAGVGGGAYRVGGGVSGAPTSYAAVMNSPAVQEKVDTVAEPIARSFEEVLRELRQRNAVGVVVAVGGRIIWADIFASTSLLQKYWPKLARSYATEALVSRVRGRMVEAAEAERFLRDFAGNHQVIDSEAGVYRHTEISGLGFKAFELTSLLPGTGFDLHLAKMAE